MTGYRVKHKTQALQWSEGLQINDQRADKSRNALQKGHHLIVCISLQYLLSGVCFSSPSKYVSFRLKLKVFWKYHQRFSGDAREHTSLTFGKYDKCVPYGENMCVRVWEILILLISWWKRPHSHRIAIIFDVSGFWVLVKHFWRFRNIYDSLSLAPECATCACWRGVNTLRALLWARVW